VVDLPCVVVEAAYPYCLPALGYVAFSYAAGMGCTWDTLKNDAV